MGNCKKCRTTVDHPVKTWKIKQTPMALYECPSCKAKWRSKFIEERGALSVVKDAIQEPIKTTPTMTATNKIDSGTLVTKTIATVVKDQIAEPNRPVGIFSGIKTFLSTFFS